MFVPCGKSKVEGRRSAAVTGIEARDLVPVNSFPTGGQFGLFLGDEEARRQVSGEGGAVVEDQGDVVGTMAGRGDDFAVQADASEEFSAVRKFQKQVVVEADERVRDVLFDLVGHGGDKVCLAFHHHQLRAEIFQILRQPGVIHVVVRNEDEFDLAQFHPLALGNRGKFRECPRPTTVHEQFTALDFERVVMGGVVGEGDEVHFKAESPKSKVG